MVSTAANTMHSKKTSVSSFQEHIASIATSPSDNITEQPLALPTISPSPTESSPETKPDEGFVPIRPGMSITKAVITPLVLQLPTGTAIQSMLQLPTGIVSPKFPVSVAVSPNETNISSFVPYLMTVSEPQALELQRKSHISIAKNHQHTQSIKGDIACSQSSAAENKADLSPAVRIYTGQLTPRTGDNSIELDAQPSSESTTTRIKRSISTIVRRSTSILRKSESTSSHSSGSTRRSSNDNTQLVVPTPKASPISRISTILSRRKSTGVTSSSPIATGLQSPPAPSYQDKSVLAAALSASYFNMVYSNGIVSPLIRGSMVHIKAVLDANTIVVVPMMRSEVFARARERIITKFFQGGVPLVESKRRKFVVCGENGHSLVIDNNPTWRRVMNSIASTHRLNAHRQANSRAVVKLTLHLMDPKDVSVMSESRQSQAEKPCSAAVSAADVSIRASFSLPVQC